MPEGDFSYLGIRSSIVNPVAPNADSLAFAISLTNFANCSKGVPNSERLT